MADFFSQFQPAPIGNFFDQFQSIDIPSPPKLPELPSPFKSLPATQPTVDPGFNPLAPDFNPIRRQLGENVGNFTAGVLSGPLSSQEVWQSPYGKAGAAIGSVGDIAALSTGAIKGVRALKNLVRPVQTAAEIPEVAAEPLKLFKKVSTPAQYQEGEIGANRIAFRGTTPAVATPEQRNIPTGFKKVYDQWGNVVSEWPGIPNDVPNQTIRTLKVPEAGMPGRTRFERISTGKPEPVGELKPTIPQDDITVPNRLKPVTSAEQSFNALIPERYKPRTEQFPTGSSDIPAIGGPSGEKYRFQTAPAKETIEEIHPKFRKQVEDAVKVSPVTAGIVQVPEIVKAASQRLSLGDRFSRFIRNSLTSSMENEFHRLGPAGDEINRMNASVSATTHQRGSQYTEPYREIYKNLNPAEQDQFWSALEMGTVPKEPKIAAAVDVAKKVDTQRNTAMNTAGVQNPATGNPFLSKFNYTPRIYPEGHWTPENIFKALKEKYPNIPDDIAQSISLGKGKENIRDRLMQTAGVDRNTADIILKMGQEKGERKIASQFSRSLNLPGYKRDLSAWEQHNFDIARKTSEQEHYGQFDIADPNSKISKLIEKTSNPDYAYDLMKIHLKRTGKDFYEKDLDAVNHVAAKVSAALYLSLFPISNMSNNVATIARFGMKNFSKSLVRTLITARNEVGLQATEDGVKYAFSRGLLELAPELEKVAGTAPTGIVRKGINLAGKVAGKTLDLAAKPIGKGISWSEDLNRSVSSQAGRMAATDYFKAFKQGTLPKKYHQMLEDLTLTPLAELSGQTELTLKQLKDAGFRGAELTQGIAESRKLPVYWSSPYFQIPLQFHKFAFQQTKIIKDAIKANPAIIPTLVGASLAAGELIGDTKATLKGGVRSVVSGKNKIPQELESRGQYLGQYVKNLPGGSAIADSPQTLRQIDNLLQSWTLGMFGDAFLTATGSARDAAYNIIGVLPATGLTFGEAGVKTLAGKPQMLGRETLKKVPYVGSGLQRELMPTKFQQNQDKKFSGPPR